jgi:hypothetical protein
LGGRRELAPALELVRLRRQAHRQPRPYFELDGREGLLLLHCSTAEEGGAAGSGAKEIVPPMVGQRKGAAICADALEKSRRRSPGGGGERMGEE